MCFSLKHIPLTLVFGNEKADQFLGLALDYFLIKLYNFLGHSLLSPFRMVGRDFILPEFCKLCLFLSFFNLRNLSYLISWSDETTLLELDSAETVCTSK